MQDRYVGDIGDFAKYSFLNCLAENQLLGVAWYHYPDESHNSDGKHTDYLSQDREWRQRDSYVFDRLCSLLDSGQRSLENVEKREVLKRAIFSRSKLQHPSTSPSVRAEFRRAWFSDVISDLERAEIVFADPDNGLREDENYRHSSRKAWKSIPEGEALKFAANRSAVIYHHNTRRPGGHEREIAYWMERLGADFAVRMRARSARTFFVINASDEHLRRAELWCLHFGEQYQLVTQAS